MLRSQVGADGSLQTNVRRRLQLLTAVQSAATRVAKKPDRMQGPKVPVGLLSLAIVLVLGMGSVRGALLLQL